MREFRERNMWRTIVYSRVTLILLILFTGFMANVVCRTYAREQASLADSQKIAERLQSIEKHTAEVRASVAALQTPQGVEREIRTKFNVVKPGEGVVLVIANGQATTTASTTPVSRGWIEQILDIFR